MKIEQNKSVLKHNTFGVDVSAKYFTSVGNEDHVRRVIQSDIFKASKNLIVGGGSNLLFTHDFDGIVILNKIKGIKEIRSDKNHVWVQVGVQVCVHCTDGGVGI